MATHIKILSSVEIVEFDNPPEMNFEQRRTNFYLTAGLNQKLKALHLPVTRVGLVLQFGYYKCSGRFYKLRTFRQKDVKFICDLLKIEVESLDMTNYRFVVNEHRLAILTLFGHQPFSTSNSKFGFEVQQLVAKRISPKKVFLQICSWLKDNKFEIPTYHTLSKIITEELNKFEKYLLDILQNSLSDDHKKLLEDLIKRDVEFSNWSAKDPLQLSKIAIFKTVGQSLKPSKIKENIRQYQEIKYFYHELAPAIRSLNLSVTVINYYATWALKARNSQLYQLSDPYNRYLHLLAFICHQYFQRSDLLIDMLLLSINTVKNTTTRAEKEQYFLGRKLRNKAVKAVIKSQKGLYEKWELAKKIVTNNSTTADEKISNLYHLIESDQVDSEILKKVKELETEIAGPDEKAYLNSLSEKYIVLKNRISGILKTIEFDSNSSEKYIFEAVKFYQLEENRLCDPPLAFLTPEEQELVFNNGKLNNALYKVLFYLYTAEAIKSGALNIKYSYKYLSIEDYLIPRSVWNNEKKLFLERAGLSQYKDISATLLFLKESVDGSFKKTNVNIQSLSNDYIKFSKDGDPVVNTPAIEKPDVDKLSSLFTSAHYTSLLKIVAEINKTTNFLSCFEHFTIKDVKARPPLEMFFAGIIGLGCNIGIEKISNISKGINSHTLENTVNWYFTMENLNTANDVIVKYINELPLSGLFRKNLEDLHTSSDGQKYGISVDSLNANYSYKYFGSGRGVTVNSFIDERYALFHANVISSSEREAAHVIDGLLHNDIIKSTIHSTDTHGYTEIVFGLTYLLGITFAPRIQNFKDQFLYSFNLISYYKEMDYQILPNKTINEGLIESQWEDVLRFTASIKLRNVTASQVLKRLSSYSRQHPLYKALKEFGKIHKTIFLLRYMDDLGLRQRIEKQLNKIELSHKFAKAVFFGGNQEYNQETKEGQEIVTGCRRLIQNCIILWNYFYLSELISNSDTIEKKKEILKIFVEGSILTWQHVNLLGEYNFQELETNILPFNLKKIMEMDFGIET